MANKLRIFLFSGLCVVASVHALAQTSDLGAIGSIGCSYDLNRKLSVSAGQEVRMNGNGIHFDRSATSVEVDYSVIKKLLKAEAGYDLLYYNKTDYDEFRHRFSLALSLQRKWGDFGFTLRTKGQSTWRDEARGDYKFNPKYVWRNKLECAYTIFGSPVKPFLSGEIFCPLNGADGFYMDGLRAIAGAKYKTSEHVTWEFFLRYDQDIQQKDPLRILYGGVGWNYKF